MGYHAGLHWEVTGWGNSGFWPIGMLVGILIVAAFVVLAAWAVRAVASSPGSGIPRRAAALDALEEHAGNEIDRKEHLRKEKSVNGR